MTTLTDQELLDELLAWACRDDYLVARIDHQPGHDDPRQLERRSAVLGAWLRETMERRRDRTAAQ